MRILQTPPTLMPSLGLPATISQRSAMAVKFVLVAAGLLLAAASEKECDGFHTGGKTSAAIQSELERYMREYGFARPERSAVDPARPWRCGAPNYDAADLLYFQGKTRNHSAGSAPAVVENLVKTWEMEASHLRFADWATVSHDAYSVSSNGAPPLRGAAAAAAGNYNALMGGVDPKLYDASKETFDSSHLLFRDAFPKGLPWELIEVLAGPPRVVFSWRHWSTFEGTYRGRKGDGRTYEMYGLCVATVDAVGKIESLEVYYEPESFLRALQGEIDPDTLRRGAAIFGDGVPVAKKAEEGVCNAGETC